MQYAQLKFADSFLDKVNLIAQKHHQNSLEGFTTSFLIILVSQIGDKTFFIAMIMALRYNKFIVFFGAYGALFLMTILSAVFGKVATSWLSQTYTNILVTFLFLYFGAKMIYQAINYEESQENQELKEVEIQMKQMEQKFIERHSQSENKQKKVQKNTKKPLLPNSYIFGQAFMMTFLAQWGDRSQIATIALAASFNVVLVSLGAVLGHFICTMGAVYVGQWISGKIHQKYVLLAGGIIFIISGLVTLIMVL